MEIQPDFKELLRLFNSNKVEYVIIGAFALAFHGAPRNTGDLDVLVKSEKDNAKRILNALDEFGFGGLDLSADDFTSPGKVIQLGVQPARFDILTSITGLTWEQIAENKVAGDYDDIPVYYMGKNELIINKKALGRHRDLADIEALGEKAD